MFTSDNINTTKHFSQKTWAIRMQPCHSAVEYLN